MPPTFGPRCCLCWERFRVGDVYKSVWPKGGPPVSFALSMHPACFAQLDPGDLGRIFAALGRSALGRALPIAVLNGRRTVLGAPFSVLRSPGSGERKTENGKR